MQFSELGLAPELLRAIGAQGYTTPTPIQAQAIPFVLAGRDLEALAQTGTGKTAAFVLPLLHRLSAAPANGGARTSHAHPRVLVVVPTRELAAQVLESVRTYGQHLSLRALAVYGGVSINPQIQALRRGIDVLVATPGRLLDHVNQRTLDLSKVETLVLDEADRMFDMGFINDIRKIIQRVPKERQTLLFSATFAQEMRDLAHAVLTNPALVEVARRSLPVELIEQSVIRVDQDRKRDALLHLFAEHGWDQTLIFTRTKHGADALAKRLEQAGIRSAALHGNKSQNARTRALSDFKSGRVAALVATDLAARGLDIDALPRVVNFELPNVPEDYVHRIGRTGRAGLSGEALSLVSGEERNQLRDIERLIKREFKKIVLPGFEPIHNDCAPRVQPRSAPSRPGQARTARPAAPGQRTGQQPGGQRPQRSGYGNGNSNGNRADGRHYSAPRPR